MGHRQKQHESDSDKARTSAPTDATVNAKNFERQGGAVWEVGGTLNINSGGVLNIETGGKIELNGVDVTPRLKVLKTSEPPGRKGGVKVPDVATLVSKLKNEAGVI